MAFKQPRVPEYRESDGTGKYIRSLVLFLKDFCMDVWTANKQRSGEIDAVRKGYPVTSVCGKTGEVTLTAGDVGALDAKGTAENAGRLDRKTWAECMLDIYPIGSIYMSVVSASPSGLFGGTWEQIKGRFLLGTGAPENNDDGTSPGDYDIAPGIMGGEAEHTLTKSEMPKHFHQFQGYWHASTDNSGERVASYEYISDDPESTDSACLEEGGDEAHNNMPPYLAVYMWKRVS